MSWELIFLLDVLFVRFSDVFVRLVKKLETIKSIDFSIKFREDNDQISKLIRKQIRKRLKIELMA
jgi:hypothetical protein